MSAAIDVTPYIGLPFADHGRGGGFDCWLLVRHVLRCEFGWLLPDYGERYISASDCSSVADAIRAGLVEGWEPADAPQLGGLVIFNITGKPWHVGLVVGPDRFLHVPAKETSCVERLSSPMWAKRIGGYYRRV